jgi:1-deoxy-D-xylulose-5-phosphate reductoisomerase
MNAANEVAVWAFLQGRLAYSRLIELVREVCAVHRLREQPDLAAILEADSWARAQAEELVHREKPEARSSV